jgi:hypothetical protein
VQCPGLSELFPLKCKHYSGASENSEKFLSFGDVSRKPGTLVLFMAGLILHFLRTFSWSQQLTVSCRANLNTKQKSNFSPKIWNVNSKLQNLPLLHLYSKCDFASWHVPFFLTLCMDYHSPVSNYIVTRFTLKWSLPGLFKDDGRHGLGFSSVTILTTLKFAHPYFFFT